MTSLYPGKHCCIVLGCKHRRSRHCCRRCLHHLFDREPSPVSDIDENSTRRRLRASKRLHSKRLLKQKLALQTTAIIMGNSSWNIATADHDSTGYRGKRVVYQGQRISRLSKLNEVPAERLTSLINDGYKLVAYQRNEPKQILDSQGRLVALFLPPSLSDDEIESVSTALKGLQYFATQKAGEKRGDFDIITFGMVMGGGTKEPSPCRLLVNQKLACEKFLHRGDVTKHLESIASEFKRFVPKMFDDYSSTLEATTRAFPRCHLPFDKIPFAAFTFNLGDRCCSERHYDQYNEAIGWCLVSPFGKWNYRAGGHIILHELKLLLEFPPGASILLPSALVEHENVQIFSGERRSVVTAYTSGSFFQFADNNFELVSSIPKGLPHKKGKVIWDNALKRLPLIFDSKYL